MNDQVLTDIKRRSVSGVIALTSRTAFLQIISFVGTFLLTIFLSPETFGVFFVVTAMVSFLNYFSDIGLAAALIQKNDLITRKDLVTTFTIQQILIGILVIIALASTQFVSRWYRLDQEGIFLYQALVISFVLSSLKTIPSILLERELDFRRLVIPQIVEVFLFYLIAVALAMAGYGIRTFTFAVLVRGVAGLVVMYIVRPWIPAFGIHRESARQILSFGGPFQMNSALALVKDDLFILFLGKILPYSQVGYIGWAKKWSEAPLRLIMDSIVKVTFPAYSRLQQHPEKLARAVEKALFFLTLLIVPISLGMAFSVEPLIDLFPQYGKWEPALTSFYLFVFASGVAGLSTPLINALNAIGKITITLRFMILWTVLQWLLAPILIQQIGYDGFAYAVAIMAVTVIGVVWVAQRYISFSLWKNVLPSLIGGAVMTVFFITTRDMLTGAWIGLFFYLTFGGGLFAASVYFLYRAKLTGEIRSIVVLMKN